MRDTSHHDETFERETFTARALNEVEFESCTFRGCDLSNVVALGVDFVDCTFESSNLAMFEPRGTGMKQVTFRDCKLVGVDFALCNEFAFGVRFERCNLDFARFMSRRMEGTVFDSCSLREATFERANLSKARFLECDLDRALFRQTTLTHADFRTASNFTIDPEANRVAKAKFSVSGLAGLLGKYDLVID